MRIWKCRCHPLVSFSLLVLVLLAIFAGISVRLAPVHDSDDLAPGSADDPSASVSAATPSGLRTLTWTAPDGTLHIVILFEDDDIEPDEESCQTLEHCSLPPFHLHPATP